MNITLLEYIHTLMICEEKNLRNKKTLAKEELRKAEKQKAQNLTELNDRYECIEEQHKDAYYLLKKFELINWK